MAKRARQLLYGAAVAGCGLLLFCAGAIWQPVWVQKLWIHLPPSSRWEQYNALGRLVIPGMTPAEVKGILGPAWREKEFAAEVKWLYHGGRGCAGNELCITFETWGPIGHKELYVREVVQFHEAVRVGPITKDYGRKYYRISVTQPTR